MVRILVEDLKADVTVLDMHDYRPVHVRLRRDGKHLHITFLNKRKRGETSANILFLCTRLTRH